MPSITETIQNLYIYIISIAGVIALVALIIGGILYLTSAGDSEKLTKAKKQILSAFFGIIILLSSYLILRTINPELVKIDLPRLKQIIFSPLQAPPSQTLTPELLRKIREIADRVKEEVVPGLSNSAQTIQTLTLQCNCINTQPLCSCTGGGHNDSCQGRECYAGPGFQPCPDEAEIKENQKNLFAWKDEILYYRNRAIVEEEDLMLKIGELEEEINYYQENINIEKNEKIVEYFREKITELEQERLLKENLAAKLRELADLTGRINAPALELAILPDECLLNVRNVCQPSCVGKCHDFLAGCQPLVCEGGNPCPIGEISRQFGEIQSLSSSIILVSNEIINIIDQINEFKTITI